MKHKGILKNFILIFVSIFIALFIVLLNVKILVQDENFYHKEFKKYNVYDTLKEYDIDKINKETVGFLLSKNGLPQNFYTQREISHLYDVKEIIGKGQILFLFSTVIILFFVIFLLIYFKKMKKAPDFVFLSIAIGCAFVLLFSFFIFVSIKLNFNLSFDVFHTIFFEKNSYIFNPENEKIVLLYPEGLFYDAGQKIILNSALFSFILFNYSIIVYKIYIHADK